MGTTVFKIMAYEKNTRREMIIAPSKGSSGTRLSHGKKERKYWPISVSHAAQAIVQNRHIERRKNTICGNQNERETHFTLFITEESPHALLISMQITA
jgi:hypothetical protein